MILFGLKKPFNELAQTLSKHSNIRIIDAADSIIIAKNTQLSSLKERPLPLLIMSGKDFVQNPYAALQAGYEHAQNFLAHTTAHSMEYAHQFFTIISPIIALFELDKCTGANHPFFHDYQSFEALQTKIEAVHVDKLVAYKLAEQEIGPKILQSLMQKPQFQQAVNNIFQGGMRNHFLAEFIGVSEAENLWANYHQASNSEKRAAIIQHYYNNSLHSLGIGVADFIEELSLQSLPISNNTKYTDKIQKALAIIDPPYREAIQEDGLLIITAASIRMIDVNASQAIAATSQYEKRRIAVSYGLIDHYSPELIAQAIV
ncbi:MAG: hypothetical protein ACOYK8_09385 [Alphaproteobacteria bacterium]